MMKKMIFAASMALASVALSAAPASASEGDSVLVRDPAILFGAHSPSAKLSGAELPAKGGKAVAVAGKGQSGMASWYALPGRRTACGPIHNPEANTAAHRSLPCGTKVQVTHRNTGKSVIVTINDRGPFVGGRVIDLSRGPARQIGLLGSGVGPVQLAVLR